MLITKANLVIWGKQFSMPVQYAGPAEPEASADLDQAIQAFIADSADITSKSILKLKAYIKGKAETIGSVAPENLFDSITPQMLLVTIDEGDALIALLCGFKFDPEHDIALIFRNNSLDEVGNQDLISWW